MLILGSKLWPLISVSMSIPGHLLLSEETKLVRWDSDRLQWKSDGFSDVQIEIENKQLSFKCQAFSTIALMQDSYLNMPYQGWLIETLDTGVVKLSITGNLHQIEITIEGEHCTLMKPDLTELHATLGNFYQINQILKLVSILNSSCI